MVEILLNSYYFIQTLIRKRSRQILPDYLAAIAYDEVKGIEKKVRQYVEHSEGYMR